MSLDRIRAILESRLAAWAAARVPALPVLWQNVGSDTEPDGLHLRCYVMPATTLSRFLEGTDRVHVGILQVSVYAPPDNGAFEAEQIAAELDALFPCYGRFTDAGGLAVQVMTPVSAAPAQEEPGWYHVACSCRYQATTTID